MTQIIDQILLMQEIRRRIPVDKSVGFVPTMGALHSGHGELLKKARAENDVVILSVFVNPTQFDNQQDLEKYPSTLQADVELAESLGTDYVWVPTYSQIYPDDYRYQVLEKTFSKTLCGAHRPGHFDGMLTIVMKLLNVTRPTRAYFGEKDYQQLLLVQDMAKTFFLDTKIVPVPTIREESGLALSSRNVRLSAQEKEVAPMLFKIISTAKSASEARTQLQEKGFKVDYVEDVQGRRLAAAYLGATRLIDNVSL